jgi:triphosphoribosyl-dephospho-CoA synthase
MSSVLQHAYLQACMAELEALKPGNVHIFADGHGMQVQDFIASAEVSAPALCDDAAYGHRPLGQRILQALQATHAKVGCNTNLGIVLLAAPLVQARLQFQELPLQTALHLVLQQTTVEDAACVYEGIRLVSPAGMGQRDAHDVSQPPQITLLHAMQLASQNDMVAQQYVDAYATIFSTVMPLYEAYSARWERSAWALTAVYLYWLSSVPDSHIQRKYGTDLASQIQNTASEHYTAFTALENPKHYMPALLKWDAELKQACINPGTSADLTVITAMISSLINGET